MPISTRIHLGPDFEDFTMTSENLRWLHSCRWEEPHSKAFLELRNTVPHSFGKAPNFVKSKAFHNPATQAQWVLVDEQESAVAWAELQSFPSRHDCYGILMWSRAHGQTERFDRQHITRLISFCFLVGKFDHMKIAGTIAIDQTLMEDLTREVGEMRRTYALARYPWYPSEWPSLIELRTLEIARKEWVASPISDAYDKTLQHVALRVKNFERAQALATPKQKRRSLLARLLHPKIDDSLF
jgi:hypothetical protein